jgi:hypothetical protein
VAGGSILDAVGSVAVRTVHATSRHARPAYQYLFSNPENLTKQRSANYKSYDALEKTIRPPGEPGALGFVQIIMPIQISGITLEHFLVLWPKAIKFEASRGNRMNVLHTICHEFAHAFGVLWRLEQNFDKRCEPYFDCLADYFSLVANILQNALPETIDTHRHLFYLSKEFEKRFERKSQNNAEVYEFANLFLMEAGVLPCPVDLLATS